MELHIGVYSDFFSVPVRSSKVFKMDGVSSLQWFPHRHPDTNSFLKGLWKVLKGSSTASTFYEILKGSFQWIRPTNITTKKTIFKYTSLWGLKSSKLWAVFLSSHKVALTNQIERGILSFFKGHLAVSKNQTHLNLKKRKSPLVTLSC